MDSPVHTCSPLRFELTQQFKPASYRLGLRIFNNVYDFSSDVLNGMSCRASRQPISKGWGIIYNFALAYIMPNRQQYLVSRYGFCHKTIKLIFRPPTAEERLREHNDTKFTAGQAAINFSPKAIADTKLKFIIPDAQACFLER